MRYSSSLLSFFAFVKYSTKSLQDQFGPSGSGSSGGGNEEAIVANELARQQRCTNIRAAYATMKCAGKATSPPDMSTLGIPDFANGIPAFRSNGLWAPIVLTYATTLFNPSLTSNDGRLALSAAFRDSLTACAGAAPCQNDVLQYFGYNQVSLPIIGTLGPIDINNAYNRYLDIVIATLGYVGVSTNDRSEAAKITNKYYGLQVCQGISSQGMNAQNRCGAF